MKRRRLSRKKISIWVVVLVGIAAWVFVPWPRVFGPGTGSAGHKAQLQACNPQLPLDTALRSRLEVVLEDYLSKESQDSTGVFVYDLSAGKMLFEHNADKQLRPASNMKMITCIAALKYLGPNYRNLSTLGYTGKLQGGTITGDLILKFGYDLWFNDSCLRRLVAPVRQKGIKKVCGRIRLQLALQEPVQHEGHWTPGDYKMRKLNMIFRGEKTMQKQVAYALRNCGLELRGEKLEVEQLGATHDRITVLSEVGNPLTREIEKAMLNSSNENAEAIALLLGDRKLTKSSPDLKNTTALWGTPGFARSTNIHRAAAVRVLKQFVEREMKTNPDLVATIHDGCGLCPMDRITPRFLAELWQYAMQHPYIYNVLYKYLPGSGQSGTMHRRLSRFPGKIHAKTGTLTRLGGITSLSGFAEGMNGHRYLFAIIQDNLPVDDARLWQDHFCRELVTFSGQQH